MKRLLLITILLMAGTLLEARQMSDPKPALISPGGLPVFFSSEGPMCYLSLTRKEIPKDAVPLGEVSGHSCQYSLSVPLTASARSTSISGAIGNGTYSKIMAEMKHGHPDLDGIYDVRADLHYISILGIFGRLCTELTAAGYH